MCLKISVQIAPPRHNLLQQTVCTSYVALRCLFCWLCLARYLCYNSLSGTFWSFSKWAAKGLRCFADILIPIASDVYLEGMPEKLLQRLRCSVKNPVLQAICANIAAVLCPLGNLITLSDYDKDSDPLMQSPGIQKYIHEWYLFISVLLLDLCNIKYANLWKIVVSHLSHFSR